MLLTESLPIVSIDLNLKGKDKVQVLESLVALAGKAQTFESPGEVVAALLERESLSTTGIGNGLAVPHCKTPQAKQLVIALGRVPQGINFFALDGHPVRLFFLLLAPQEAANSHLKALAKVARFAKNPSILQELMDQPDPERLLAFLKEQDALMD